MGMKVKNLTRLGEICNRNEIRNRGPSFRGTRKKVLSQNT